MAANDHLSAEHGGDAPPEPVLSGGSERSGAEAEPVNEPSDNSGSPLPSGSGEGEAASGRGDGEEAGASAEAQHAEAPEGEGAKAEAARAQDEAAGEGEPQREAAAEGGSREAAGEGEAPEPAESAQGTGADEGKEEVHPPEPRFPEAPRKRHHVAPALISLDRVVDDETFRIRPEGDLSLLATDIARLGQLFPVDLRLVPPDRFQVISGFRRVAALRFLQRDKVLARLHTDLDDEDALLMALAAAIHSVPVEAEELTELKDRLESEGRLSAAARDMLEKALTLGEALAPEGPEVEIDADELALDVTARLGAINQDLALLADVFASLDEARRAELLDQLRYSADLVTFLEGK